ncbi:MAG: hypothetical protein P1Q69_07055 [Candidatus Thorarchaeota archaeon]|nr:hypothetical protein [Candidatus Thorarchaeota archaeon]
MMSERTEIRAKVNLPILMRISVIPDGEQKSKSMYNPDAIVEAFPEQMLHKIERGVYDGDVVKLITDLNIYTYGMIASMANVDYPMQIHESEFVEMVQDGKIQELFNIV